MKKLLAMALAATMAVSLVACSPKTETNDDAQASVKKVGVIQLIQHPALDDATQGFVDALKAELGDGVVVDVQNASGESANLASIADGYVVEGVDLIMANATGALQAAVSATNEIPILGTSVTDYATALEIADWSGVVGGNVSGTSDLAPLDQQAAMIKELCPDAKTVGLLYCSAEANSIYQCTVIKGYLEEMGYEVKDCSFADTNELASVVEKACDDCDALYIPTDNTAANAANTIGNIVSERKVPVIAGEEGICKGCGVATLSIKYYDLGYATGKMAAKVLTGEADISTMPVSYAETSTKEYNADMCATLGMEIPADYVAIGE